MSMRWGLFVVAASLGLLVGASGCISAGAGGAALPADNTVPEDEVGDGAGNQDGEDGEGGEGGEGGGEVEDGAGDGDGDGDDGDAGAPEIELPTANLFTPNPNATPGSIVLLTCSVEDAGGGTITGYAFSSSAGADTLTHDGVSSTASAFITPGLTFITYTCAAINEAGQGPDSNLVTVNIGG